MRNVFYSNSIKKGNFSKKKFLQIFDVCFRHFPIFVLCYIHTKLATLKIFYSSQKHVIASYTGLPKKKWIQKQTVNQEIRYNFGDCNRTLHSLP